MEVTRAEIAGRCHVPPCLKLQSPGQEVPEGERLLLGREGFWPAEPRRAGPRSLLGSELPGSGWA